MSKTKTDSKLKIPSWLKKFNAPASGDHQPKAEIYVDLDAEFNREACIMEVVNLISPKYEVWGTDAKCVNDGLASLAIEINDNIDRDKDRQKILKFAPRFLGTAYKKNAKQIRDAIDEWSVKFLKRNKQ